MDDDIQTRKKPNIIRSRRKTLLFTLNPEESSQETLQFVPEEELRSQQVETKVDLELASPPKIQMEKHGTSKFGYCLFTAKH